MRIRYFCPTCGDANTLPVPAASGQVQCRNCSARLALQRPDQPRAGEPVSACTVCGNDGLFIQKQFNQKAGCLIVGLGAALVPWTYGLSLAVCALVDFLLYRVLPLTTVCYVCDTRYLDTPVNPDHKPYDLLTAQTFEPRSLHWRAGHDAKANPAPR
ncbi:MAG: hypothetical protein ACE5HU_00155 [Acidobacteriota bacterium]